MGIVRDLYYARKMSAGLKLPAPTVALLIKRLRLAAAMGGGVTKTVSGSPAHITDALAKAALSVLASIEPIQDLHGYAKPWTAGGGKNIGLLAVETEGNQQRVNKSYENNGVIATSTGSYGRVGYIIPVTTGETYTVSFKSKYTGSSVQSFKLGDSVNWSDPSYGSIAVTTTLTERSKTFTATSNTLFFGVYPSVSGNVVTVEDFQLELGSTATAFEPYENICPLIGMTGLSVYVSPTQDPADATEYAVNWSAQAGTVYGGTVDVVSGELTVDMVNIPSYNGETINEPWLSSMDAYAAGTTPTIGAQVVYTLATPVTYQLTPQEVQMFLGENYVWASSGDTVSVTYYAEGNANTLQSLNILLGGRYSNPKTADDVSDKEALDIILGGNK